MNTLRARSGAKINLSLDILDRLANGYHTLRSVVHPVGLWDELELEFCPDAGIVFECSDAALAGEDNLCVRAFKLWRDASGYTGGATIRLHKRIPHGAGLGGGSGNAAATLRLANAHGAAPLGEAQLFALAARLGADVPLFLRDSPALMEGIGEQLSDLAPLAGWAVLLKPREGFATPAIYRAWDEAGLRSNNGTDALLDAWGMGTVEAVAPLVSNDLERAARLVSPLPARCVALLKGAGALGAGLSGSGSACFGLCADEASARAVEEKVIGELAKDVLLEGATTRAAPLVARGVEPF